MKILNQKGFTLIELMISILIGLIIIAAVTQIYVAGVRSSAIQKAASGVLDANVFGLQQIEKSLRMTGLGLGKTSNLNAACSGVIISSGSQRLNCDLSEVTDKSADMYSVKLEGLRGTQPLAVEMRTKAEAGPVNTSNNTGSQLTIQYRAPVDMRDCEGRLALGPREVVGYAEGRKLDDNSRTFVNGQVIIERYFTKRNDAGELELRCDAGRYVLEHIITEPNPKHKEAEILGENSAIMNMGDDGSLIIAGLDDFQVQLGVAGGGAIKYQNIADYKAGDIVAVKLGIIAKGNEKIPQIDAPEGSTFTLLGKENITLASNQPTNIIRRTYETTTMLRNSREGKK